MQAAKDFCTCTDLKCPCHPANHDRGCDLCIQKNLKQKDALIAFSEQLTEKNYEKKSGFSDRLKKFTDDLKKNFGI